MPYDEIEVSVIIPTYERPRLLKRLLHRLSKTSFRPFEVIVVDQSAVPLQVEEYKKKLNLQYHHVSFRGAAVARNYGASIAKGKIIAFTDDDCIPAKNWLELAFHCFENQDIIGLEGRIHPEKHKTNPSKFRIVSNIGRENIAFMTANLFVKRKHFIQLSGFDERFNQPHFREDTDFGWRLQKMGSVVFSDEVKVLHPAEKLLSGQNRHHFFVHDALLFSKFPDKYLELFVLEEHYIHTEGFWEYFLQGFQRHQVHYAMLNLILANSSVNLGYVPLAKILMLLNCNSSYYDE